MGHLTFPKSSLRSWKRRQKRNFAKSVTVHITNIDQTDPAVTSFDVDEVIDYVNAGIDISVKAPLLPAVGFKVEQLPIAISPGLASGHHVFTSVDSSAQSNDLITVTGSVGLNDKNGEQYTCITFDAAQSSVSV